MQIKYITSFVTQPEKKKPCKPPKVTAAKQFFSSVYVTVAAWLNNSFLFHVITGRHYFL